MNGGDGGINPDESTTAPTAVKPSCYNVGKSIVDCTQTKAKSTCESNKQCSWKPADLNNEIVCYDKTAITEAEKCALAATDEFIDTDNVDFSEDDLPQNVAYTEVDDIGGGDIGGGGGIPNSKYVNMILWKNSPNVSFEQLSHNHNGRKMCCSELQTA